MTTYVKLPDGEQARPTPLWAIKAIWCLGVGASGSLWRFLPVFLVDIGQSTTHVGFLLMLNPWATFVGSLYWSSLCDRTGAYKKVLVLTNLIGMVVVAFLMIPAVQARFWAVTICLVIGSGLLASRAGVTDALTNKVVMQRREIEKQRLLNEAKNRGDSNLASSTALSQWSYGRQRLWAAVGFGFFGLLTGFCINAFGYNAMFGTTFFCLVGTILVSSTLPSDPAKKDLPSGPSPNCTLSAFMKFEVLWFFANLVFYGVHMALVETFLFIYLQRDFVGANTDLFGLCVAVMCTFELPVFYYIQHAIDKVSLTTLLSGCHMVFAFRVFAYSMLPFDHPWLVLFIEPLHGITSAAMWACSVEFGRRLAPEGLSARMQALASGIYYRAALGLGSLLWGRLSLPAPAGVGFPVTYFSAGINMIVWSVVWNLGWRFAGSGSKAISDPQNHDAGLLPKLV